MARKTYNELIAGIFVIVALAAALGVVIWIGGAGLFAARQQVVFYLPQAAGSTGVDKGSFVKVNDADAGEISEIRYDPQNRRTLYIAQLSPDAMIHTDAQVEVQSGFVGAANVVILSLGSDDAPLADEEHPVRLQVGGLSGAVAELGDVVAQVKLELDRERSDALMSKIHEMADRLVIGAGEIARIGMNIESETDAEQAGSLLAKVHGSMDDINAMTADARPKLERALSDVSEASGRLTQYAEHDLAKVFSELREASTEIYNISRDFAVVAAEAKGIMLVNRERIDETIDNIAVVSANLKAASKEIRRNPWRLLYEPDEGELHSQNVYDAARAFSNGAEQLDQALLKLTGLAKAHPDGIPADDPQLAKIRQQLTDAFGRFNTAEQALWKELQK